MPSPEKQEHVFGKNTMSGTRRAKLEALRKRENDRAKEGRKQQLEAKKRPGPRRGSKSQPLAALPMSASAPALAAAAAAAAAAAPAVAAAALTGWRDRASQTMRVLLRFHRRLIHGPPFLPGWTLQ